MLFRMIFIYYKDLTGNTQVKPQDFWCTKEDVRTENQSTEELHQEERLV